MYMYIEYCGFMIVLSYAPSAAAVWQYDCVRARHTKIYYIFAEETPAIFCMKFVLASGWVRYGRRGSQAGSPKIYQRLSISIENQGKCWPVVFSLFHSLLMGGLGAARLPIRFPPQLLFCSGRRGIFLRSLFFQNYLLLQTNIL